LVFNIVLFNNILELPEEAKFNPEVAEFNKLLEPNKDDKLLVVRVLKGKSGFGEA
jgi:hypothetical protein